VRGIDTPRQPRRVIVDSKLEIAPTRASCRASRAGSWAPPREAGEGSGAARARARDHHAAQCAGKVDLPALMLELGRREINELHVEAGAKLNGSLVREGCVDELLVYLAPSLIGAGAGHVRAAAAARLADKPLRFHGVTQRRRDLRILARFHSNQGKAYVYWNRRCRRQHQIGQPLGRRLFAGVRLAIDAGGLPLADVALGDSIAINGACMTVVEKTGRLRASTSRAKA
jgi:hypothetical protein